VGGVKNSMVAMDMEIWNPAIPQLQGSKPFEQIPFLVCTYDGEKQENYFATGTEQGALEFAEALIKLTENYKSVLVYDKTMEISTIEMLINKVPAQKTPLERLCNKIHDIFEVFLGLHFYDPAFKNNFSLKTTAGVLLGEQIGYAQISSGLEAMAYYNQFLHSEEGEEKEKLKQALIQYCDADCKATFELFGYLKSNVNH
jgi:predicted RecB family nuclease